jgi:L-2-hydroxyglutarate oxidase
MAAVHVPEEGIVDYRAVCDMLRQRIEALGGQIALRSLVHALRRTSANWEIDAGGETFAASIIVNCAGLHSDRIARLAGERPATRIVPFRGEYWKLRPESTALVRHLIYPVPDPAFPFLGVHFTRMIQGGVEAGPNAVLALSREGYRWSTIDLRDVADALAFPGLWRFLARHPRVATYEVARSVSRELFVRSLQRLIPRVTGDDLIPGPSGVRAQVMSRSGALVQDFEIIARPGAVHVLNAPSPGATASLAIGSEISRKIDELAQL